MPVEIHLFGVQEAIRELDLVAAGSQAPVQSALGRIAVKVRDRARQFAPISPNRKAKVNNLVAKGWSIKRATAKTKRRNPRATSGPKPGTLQNAIKFLLTRGNATIFVPLNSGAGKYAFKIHEEKGISWFKRGLGTVAKGAHADHKFITRAIAALESDMITIIKDEYRKVTGYDLT
jgi:hypothetical protein